MTSANNTDIFGAVSRIFNPPPSDPQVLAELDAKDPQVRALVESAMAVYTELGHGFLVPVYRQAMSVEFTARGIRHETCPQISINYKGHFLETGYEADFICYNDTLVLVTSVIGFERTHDLQLISHIKCTGLRRGLYLNFAMERLEFRRIVAPSPGGQA